MKLVAKERKGRGEDFFVTFYLHDEEEHFLSGLFISEVEGYLRVSADILLHIRKKFPSLNFNDIREELEYLKLNVSEYGVFGGSFLVRDEKLKEKLKKVIHEWFIGKLIELEEEHKKRLCNKQLVEPELETVVLNFK